MSGKLIKDLLDVSDGYWAVVQNTLDTRTLHPLFDIFLESCLVGIDAEGRFEYTHRCDQF
jgi:hypothetical protein